LTSRRTCSIPSRAGEALGKPTDFFRACRPRGGIIGIAEIVDCVAAHTSPWFEGPFGFVLRNARKLSFRPMPGG
jgi:hypothetical protein